MHVPTRDMGPPLMHYAASWAFLLVSSYFLFVVPGFLLCTVALACPAPWTRRVLVQYQATTTPLSFLSSPVFWLTGGARDFAEWGCATNYRGMADNDLRIGDCEGFYSAYW